MIQAKDLRIGNWLFWADNKTEFEITIGILISVEFWNHIENKDIKPIPLTEEWLIKFGFKKNKDCFKKFAYEVGMVGNHLWYLDNGSSMLIDRLEYVHQLQNLYHALTGEELTPKEEANAKV